MPIYVYQAREGEKGCERCSRGYEEIEPLSAAPSETCPACGAAVERVPAAPHVGFSQSSLDDRAKAAGFTKLQRLGHGEYERKY